MLDFVAVYFRDFGDGQIGRVIMQTRLMVAVCVALAVFVGVSSLGAQGGSFRLVTDAQRWINSICHFIAIIPRINVRKYQASF